MFLQQIFANWSLIIANHLAKFYSHIFAVNTFFIYNPYAPCSPPPAPSSSQLRPFSHIFIT